MSKRRIGLSGGFVIALAVILAACSQATATPEPPAAQEAGELVMGSFPKNADGYADITVDQLAALLPDKDFALVNVHIPYDGEIEQTDSFIQFDQITDHLDELPDKDAPIVLYCRSGNMSTTAAQELAELGYTNVAEVDGGMKDWQAAGYDLLNKDQ